MKKAFSLLELSIVIIIIGLIIVGSVGGSKLIEEAKLQKVSTEISSIRKAVNMFQAVYNQLPGDFSKASNFGFTSNYTGDGDDKIEILNNEYKESWLDLVSAGFLDYTLADVANIGSDPDTDTNHKSFASGFNKNSCYHGLWTGSTGQLSWQSGAYSGMDSDFSEMGYALTVLGIDADDTTTNTDGAEYNRCTGALFTALQAKKIDTKLDDGKPHTGEVRIRLTSQNDVGSTSATVTTNDSTGCLDANGNQSTTENYNVASSGIACNLVMKAE